MASYPRRDQLQTGPQEGEIERQHSHDVTRKTRVAAATGDVINEKLDDIADKTLEAFGQDVLSTAVNHHANYGTLMNIQPESNDEAPVDLPPTSNTSTSPPHPLSTRLTEPTSEPPSSDDVDNLAESVTKLKIGQDLPSEEVVSEESSDRVEITMQEIGSALRYPDAGRRVIDGYNHHHIKLLKWISGRTNFTANHGPRCRVLAANLNVNVIETDSTMEILQKWIDQKGIKATIHVLINGLYKTVGERKIVDELYNHINDHIQILK